MKLIENTETKLLKSIPIDAEIPIGWLEVVIENELIEIPIPQTAKNMRFRLALIKSGISLKAINDAINLLPDGVQKEQIQTLWEFADFFERTDATFISMAQSLGITNEQLDNFFIISNQ